MNICIHIFVNEHKDSKDVICDKDSIMEWIIRMWYALYIIM